MFDKIQMILMMKTTVSNKRIISIELSTEYLEGFHEIQLALANLQFITC